MTIFAIITQTYETFLLVEIRSRRELPLCSKVFLRIMYHLLMIKFFLFFFRETQVITVPKKIADLPPYFKIINPLKDCRKMAANFETLGKRD